MNPTTPSTITQIIIDFCAEIDSTTKPVIVPVMPSKDARLNYCMTDVPAYVENNGGSVKYGWTIWELPDIFLEAEFHSVWLNPEGKLIDIIPKLDNEKEILFLPDSSRVYENKLVENIRKPLVDNEYTHAWLMVEKKRYEIRKKHFKDGEVNGPAAEAEMESWVQTIERQKQTIGRNDPCYCESGKKYKKCCGQY